jgi:hypothetical protein
MPVSEVFALQSSGCNPFLFASVGTEHNGMTLTPVSIFARLGEDPWREARRLAGLPKSAAVDSLARTIVSMPTSRWALPDATMIASRLIALLPAPGSAKPTALSMPSQMIHVVMIVLLLAAMTFATSGMFKTFTTAGSPSGGTGASAITLGEPLAPTPPSPAQMDPPRR